MIITDIQIYSDGFSQAKGSEVLTYGGMPVSYASCPTETVYILIYVRLSWHPDSISLLFVCSFFENNVFGICLWSMTPIYCLLVSTGYILWNKIWFSLIVYQINYVSAHDNETLFDIVSLKVRSLYSLKVLCCCMLWVLTLTPYLQTAMGISVDERCRINHLATSIIALSQV